MSWYCYRLVLDFFVRWRDVPVYATLAEIFLESSEDVGVGVILGGVNNHFKAFMLHPVKDQRGSVP